MQSLTDVSSGARGRLHTHEELDESEDIVYEASNGGGGTSAAAPGNGSLHAESSAAANLYTFSPSELKSDMDKMKGLLHLKP